ncbi:hypothetical protein N5C66_27690 [Rhizobium pusense]|nr:hypothetical protein [Agrobacterium pusense]MDH1098915.1 hypothetical protein [Agrobacterium pusense]MDH1115483.1 hypothetical protein [Agrobacterium pusense]
MMDVATHDAVVEKLIREKMAVEGDLRDARQRADRMSAFLDQIGLSGSMIGDGFPWEHHVSQLVTTKIDESRMGSDLPERSRAEILMAARSIQRQTAE